MATRIKDALAPLHPEKVILFGSYAWGRPTPDSDIDLYVVTQDDFLPATERFYSAILLVFTNYRPKIHDLEKLTHMVGGCDPAFLTVFPRATDKQRECFDLLKRAYIEARYSSAYQITQAQLEYLGVRVQALAAPGPGDLRGKNRIVSVGVKTPHCEIPLDRQPRSSIMIVGICVDAEKWP